MLKTGFLLTSLFITLQLVAQPINEVGKIALSVVMPDSIDGFNAAHLSMIETRIIQVVTTSGLAASGGDKNFVIYPKLAIYESETVEGGMQNIFIVTLELSLFIKQVKNNLLYSTMSVMLKGSGTSNAVSITNALSKITATSSEFKNFIETGKEKILSYYELKCDDIILQAESLMSRQQFDEAIALSMTIPTEVSVCYSKAQKLAMQAYKAYQSRICAEVIHKAKTTLAKGDQRVALDILTDIDPSASCFQEAQAIANSTASLISAEEEKKWAYKVKQYNDAISLEKQRISSIKEIALAYWNRQPHAVNYYLLVR